MKLRDWLEEHDARKLWQAPVKGVGTVTAWNVNTRVVLVLEYANDRGWELFTALDSNSIHDTLVDAEKRVGAESKVPRVLMTNVGETDG